MKTMKTIMPRAISVVVLLVGIYACVFIFVSLYERDYRDIISYTLFSTSILALGVISIACAFRKYHGGALTVLGALFGTVGLWFAGIAGDYLAQGNGVVSFQYLCIGMFPLSIGLALAFIDHRRHLKEKDNVTT